MDLIIICEYCESKIQKQNKSRHLKTDSCMKVQNIIKKHINKQNIQNDEINKLKNILIEKDKHIEHLNTEIITLRNTAEEYRKIVEKAATKSSKTIKNNFTNNTNNTNNYLNYISTEPLKISELKTQVNSLISNDTVMLDDEDFHEHIVDNILKDKNGIDKVLCTDINRKNFTYKDEKSGNLVYDPELERIREHLRKGADTKKIKGNLLKKLKEDYENNDCVGKDPYEVFTEMINKLNFGIPFVEHVAKKTYIKSKSGILEEL